MQGLHLWEKIILIFSKNSPYLLNDIGLQNIRIREDRVQKYLKKQLDKNVNMNIQWKGFRNFYAWNNCRRVDMPLKSIN